MSSYQSQSDVRPEGCESRARRVLPDSLIASQRGSVTLLRRSRAAKRNAQDDPTIAGIESFFSDPPKETRAIVLHGEGNLRPACFEVTRLARQATFVRDLTEDVLRRAGVERGMRVLDLGCGVGDTSLLLAKLVGPTGLERPAFKCGHNLRFEDSSRIRFAGLGRERS